MAHSTSNPPAYGGDEAFDLSQIFIGRQQQLDFFDIYLSRWQQLLFDSEADDDTLVTEPPSANNKLQGLVVLLYGRGGFGKSTLLRRYRDIALQEHRHLAVSQVIDWEFAIEGKRSLFNPPPDQPIDAAEYYKVLHAQLSIKLDKNRDDFKNYQKATGAVESARKQANRIIENLHKDPKDSRFAFIRQMTAEGLVGLLQRIPGPGDVLKNEQIASAVKGFASAGVEITTAKLLDLYARLRDRLDSRLGDYLNPDLKLGLSLGCDLAEFARNFPLLIFLDTYEEVDEGDRLLRIVMAAAGMRVGWVIAGRDNLWSGREQRERSLEVEYGYKELVPADRGLSINFNAGDVGAFTLSDILDYFALLRKKVRYVPPLPDVEEQDAKRILDVTQGVPLAVKIAAGLYLERATIEVITERVDGKREIVDQMVHRYLLHTRAEQNEKARLYGLALLRRADVPAAVAAALNLKDDDAKTHYASELSSLHRRYSFIFTEKEEPSLHQEVRHFLRLWLLERRTRPEIIEINERLKKAHENELTKLEEKRKYDTLKMRMQDDNWVEVYLDLTQQHFWLDPVEGVMLILPLMIAAAIYRRNMNEDAAEVGEFFQESIGLPYREWWQWADESLIFLHSRSPSPEELNGLEKLEALIPQRRIDFPQFVQGSQQELEAALWWRLGEAYSDKDNTKSLAWYEKALTKLGDEEKLRADIANVCIGVVRKLNEEKKHRECLPLLDRAVELKQDLAHAYSWRGYVYGELKDHQKAIEDCTRAIELDPKDAVAYYNRGIRYADLGKHEQAIQDYTKAIELDPSYVDAYNNRGARYADLGKHELTIQDYMKAIELDPNYATAYNNRGTTYAALGEHELAIQDYTKVIELDPSYATAYYNRGNSYADLGEHEQAIFDYTKAIELDPSYATAYYNRGNSYAKLGKHEQAIQDYTKAIELDPSYVDAYNNRGNRYADLGKHEQAILDYTKAIELDPSYVETYYNRGNRYADLGMHEQAIFNYTRAIELDPSYVDAYNNRGASYTGLDQHEQAIQDYTKAIGLDPNYANAYFNRALVHLSLKQATQASKDFLRSYELDPAYFDAALLAEWSGMTRQRAGRDVTEQLEKIGASDMQDYYAHVCRGIALGLRGKLKDGLLELEAAIDMDSDKNDAYFWKGMLSAYFYRGRHQQAMEAIEKALELGMPPILLTPLYWLEKDVPEFFAQYAKPLLDKHEM
jgi:tetratricopeptide (TPR) repeat protein